MSIGDVREMPIVLDEGVLIDVFINHSFKITQFIVNYKKVQTVFAEIGGMISLVITISFLVLKPMMRVDFISKFISKVFLIEKHRSILPEDLFYH